MTRLRPRGLPSACACAVAFALVACGGAEVAKSRSPNPVRSKLERSLASLDAKQPVRLRYNPGACDCPPFEAEIAGAWVRADWSNASQPDFLALIQALRKTAPEHWPLMMTLRARVDGEVMRTAQGLYSVRLEASKLVEPPSFPAGIEWPPAPVDVAPDDEPQGPPGTKDQSDESKDAPSP